jgi:hypothetical protein
LELQWRLSTCVKWLTAVQPDGVGIVLSLEGKDAGVLGRARDFLVRELPPGAIASEEANSPRYSAAESRSEFAQQ